MVDAKLLELRNAKNAKKPDFVRQEAWKRPRLKIKWRQPKGGQSKLRKKEKGKRKQPSLGYCSPTKVKGLNREGFKERLVNNVKDLEGFDEKIEIITIANIGIKKRVEILKKCLEKKYKVSNVKDIENYIKNVEDKLKEKKKEIKEREEKKKKAKEKALKKKEKEEKKEEEKIEEKPKEEETKKGEKSDKIKILEQRG
ncbi:MAG: eL32 family ribosomal protein [archaeon]